MKRIEKLLAANVPVHADAQERYRATKTDLFAAVLIAGTLVATPIVVGAQLCGAADSVFSGVTDQITVAIAQRHTSHTQ